MAFDGFMWFEGNSNGAPPVNGETLDDFFKQHKAFAIKSFSVDAENPTSVGSAGGGSGTGKAKLNPFKVSKWTDNCSPSLFLTCCTGGHYKKAHIAVRKAGAQTAGTGNKYLHFTFRQVFVCNIEWSGESEDELPTENVQFAYGSLEMQYIPQTSTGGQGTPNIQCWNQVTNSQDSDVPDPTV
ncbi:MAG: Hcp family type VI secretion system effector [Gemmataceae bacterium]